MKIHTDTLTTRDLIYASVGIDGVFVEYIERGSRSRARAFDVALSALPRKGRRTRNSGNRGAAHDSAATWDEWGVFIDDLFRTDPDAVIGDYRGYDDFRWQTGERYDTRDFTPCDQHKWGWDGGYGDDWSHSCTKNCGAVRRTPIREGVTA